MTRTHIVTGATGFIGAALVLELLRRTEDSVVAIVRSANGSAEERGLRALKEASAAYGLPNETLDFDHCRIVTGDLLEADCGVTERIAESGGQFWHCAASLRYEDRYQGEIRATNVGGTAHAISLARRLEVATFNYVSTAYVAGTRSGQIREGAAEAAETNNHYERSKVEAEALVTASQMQTRIFRPSIVIGHSRTLAATAFSGFYGFARQMAQLHGILERTQRGLASRTAVRMRVDPELGANLVPVDAVVEEMVRIGCSPRADGVFHLTHPSPPTVGLGIRTICQSVGLGEPVFTTDKNDFTALDRQVDKRIAFYGSYFVGDKWFERSRTDAALAGRPVSKPEMQRPELEAFTRWYLEKLAQERGGRPVAR